MVDRAGRWRRSWRLVAGFLALAGICIFAAYRYDMGRIAAYQTASSTVVQTRHGLIEYTIWGDGPPILVVHGAGGGYDQGRLIPEFFAADGYRWISVSRFGYLRSDLPTDASTSAQAQAFADLLDALDIDRVGVIAMSGGVPPSLQFARQYPDRTPALVLLSGAPFTPMTVASQDLPMPAWIYQLLFRYDFPFWAILKVAPSSLDRIFDVTAERRASMSSADLAFVDGLTQTFLPVTQRLAGLQNEGAAVDPAASYDLDAITAPALVIHARDDQINPFPIGEYTADHLSAAEFMPLNDGGHLLLGHQDIIRERIMSFLAGKMAQQ
jgi:pimeloyl-ACP methyl ester carboxylesterase